MASCSLTSDLAGGNGCTTCRLTRILSKGCSDKVRPCVLISTERRLKFNSPFIAIGRQQINCSPIEFSTLNPPSGMTCEEYMNPYIASAGGYLTNPTASTACQFCSVRTTDEFMKNAFNIFYDHHWRNLGIFIAFIFFNVRLKPSFSDFLSLCDCLVF